MANAEDIVQKEKNEHGVGGEGRDTQTLVKMKRRIR
jgi:hypothetical protein